MPWSGLIRRVGFTLLALSFAVGPGLMPRALAAPATPALPVLGGDNLLVGTGTGLLRVTLARPVDLNSMPQEKQFWANVPLRLSGGAIGYRLELDAADEYPPAFAVFALPTASEQRTQGVLGNFVPGTTKPFLLSGVLPAGRYRLTLISNGPGSVRFGLPGLAGRTETRLRTTQAVRSAVLDAAAPNVPGTDINRPYYSNGLTGTSAHVQEFFGAFWEPAHPPGAGDYQQCSFPGRPTLGNWQLSCAPLTGYGLQEGVGPGVGSTWATSPTGVWSVGLSYTIAGVVRRAGFYLIYLPQCETSPPSNGWHC